MCIGSTVFVILYYTFVDEVLKKCNCVKSLQLLHKAVTVDGKTMFLHNTHLFSRLSGTGGQTWHCAYVTR